MAQSRKKRPRSDAPRNRHRRDGEPSRTTVFFESSQVVKLLLFFGFTALAFFICFFGLEDPVPAVVTGQRAQSRVVAEFDYQYLSEIATRQKRQEARDQVLQVYRLSLQPFNEFRTFLTDLQERLQVLALQLETTPPNERAAAVAAFSESLLSQQGYAIEPEAIQTLLSQTAPRVRERLFEQGLDILRDIYQNGVYRSEEPFGDGITQPMSLVSLVDRREQAAQVEVQPLPEAVFELNQRLRFLAEPGISRALFQLFRSGLQSNLVFDQKATSQRKLEAEQAVEPVTVRVFEGDTILEPSAITTDLDQEKLLAYRNEIHRQNKLNFTADKDLVQRMLLTLGITFAAALYIHVLGFRMGRQNRRIALVIIAVLANLGLNRLVLEIGETELFSQSPEILAILPYIAPTSFCAMVVTLLIGPSFAVLAALIVSLFFSLMMGGAFETLFTTFLSSLIAIYFCRVVRKRSTVVKAGFFAGLTVALAATFLGLLNEVSFDILLRQIVFALFAGIVTGIIVVGILPIPENLFQLTTEITLLELTDYNHPLLRRMQVDAPGSYHHSLMVANLSENAAAAVGANPLVCRTCAIFHDIGKLVKPEYFTENQRGGINPHLAQNPSMSALVIKAHVKEGVQLARQHKLPRNIIEVIRQHHGTSLIQYFYYTALKKSKNGSGNTGAPFPEAPTIKAEEVDESTYRYDGPKPRFKESAIILFADSVEAASRSLKKVTPAAIDELLDRIFQDRLEDHQLDDCPITFQEIAQIKKSFSFTLLNMLHSRVEYPRKEDLDKPAEAPPEAGRAGKGSESAKTDQADAEASPSPKSAHG